MKKLILLFFIYSSSAWSNLNIATTTTDLESVVRAVGQDKLQVFSIPKGTQDPHQIEAKPSFMVKLRSVDVIVSHGLELESAWLNSLIQGARNTKLNNKNAILELGPQLDPIEVQTGKNLSRADGDVHPGGNSHFQLDPQRMGKAAILIAQRLGELDTSHKEFFLKNAETYQRDLEDKSKKWKDRITKKGIKEIVTYHKTFSYFCNWLNLVCELQIEPKPGIPPTANHLLKLSQEIGKRKIGLVFIENLYEDSAGEKLKTNNPHLNVERVPVSVGGEASIKNTQDLIESLIKTIEKTNL